MSGLYTKAMLTIIAAAACVIAVKVVMAPEPCGTKRDQPCRVTGYVSQDGKWEVQIEAPSGGLPVRIER